MVWDWGLFEGRFNGSPPRCEFFMVQAHRIRRPPKWKRLRPELERWWARLVESTLTVQTIQLCASAEAGIWSRVPSRCQRPNKP